MRRILQFSTLVLILTVFLTPISEAFDRWDPAGLGHDTEFAVFAFVFSLTLVLIVSELIAVFRRIILLLRCPGSLLPDCDLSPSTIAFRIWYLFSDISPPLRI